MAIEWKFKDGAEPQGSSDGFWYDMTDGGYIAVDEALADDVQIAAVDHAVEVLQSFEAAMQKAGLIIEF